MFKRVSYGSGAVGVIIAVFLLGTVSFGSVFAQSAPATATPAAPAAQEQSGADHEQAESAALASQAKISVDQAKAAALAKVPGGTDKQAELGSENGAVVYDVSLTDSAGKGQDVKVDATSGAVLGVEADGPEGPETGGGAADGTGGQSD